MRYVIAAGLIMLLALCGPALADNLATDITPLKRGAGVSFTLTKTPTQGATIAFDYYLAPRLV